MNIAWLTWKDHRHPEAGGAEIVARELCKRLVTDGHRVTMLTAGYDGAPAAEDVDGVQIIRIGHNRYLHPFQALFYYLRHLRGKFDVLIEEVNAAPYFSVLFERKARRHLLYHQLERPVWLYETKPPLAQLGYYLLEPVATKLLSLSGTPVITISESTAQDLAKYGFAKHSIISEGIELEPLGSLASVRKDTPLTILSLGAMRAMKRTLDQIEAFEIAKEQLPELKLKIAGKADGPYGQKVLARIAASAYEADIEYVGKVSREQKILLMQRAHLILQTAVHEGWGLTVTEAASQGTPAIVYDVNGLRDSVRHAETGIITDPQPQALAEAIVGVLKRPRLYESLRKAAWEWSKQITFDQSYRDFKQAIGVV